MNGVKATVLAAQLGVTIPTLRRYREVHLKEGEHWAVDPDDRRAVLFTETGVGVLQAALRLKDTPTPTQEPGTAVSMHVVSNPRGWGVRKGHFPNPHVIEAEDARGARHIVWVKSAENFRSRLVDGHRMQIQATQRGGRWELVGRCPRFPGKW